MPDQSPKYPGEKSVSICIPERLRYAIEEQIIPALLSNPEGGIYGDVILGDISRLEIFKLHGKRVVRLDDLRAATQAVLYPSKRFWASRSERDTKLHEEV